MKRGFGLLVLSVSVLTLFVAQIAHAERFTSSGYIIDASEVGNSFGGDSSDADYQLTSSGGESVIGQGSGGSYTLDSGYVAQLQNSMQLSVQPNALEAYYPFETASGTGFYDHSANLNNGYVENAPSWTTGIVGNGVSLNGSTQQGVVPNAAELSLTGDFTVSMWLKPGVATQTSLARTLSKFDGTSINYMLAYDSAGTHMRFLVDCDARATITGTVTLTSTSSWYHVVGVKSGTGVTLYVNGATDGTATCSGTVKTTTSNLGIGGTPGTPYFNGAIDEVKLFSRALSANEVKAEYDAGVAGNTSGLSFATDIVPGVSQTSNFDAIVLTDAVTGYALSVSQDQNLTSGGNTIPAVSGTIASPSAWTEGATKGLGFTLYGTNATSIDAKWSSGSAYAAFPGTATSFYARSGAQGSKDVLNMRLRLDVASTQAAGVYTNVITTTGTTAL